METKKNCLRCGRVMYVNDYCKPCSRILLDERREKYYAENPNEKFNAEYLRDVDSIQIAYRKERIKERRSPKFNYGLSDKLRSKVRCSIKSKSLKTQDYYNELVGCSVRELKKHLESKFLEGMTWENYGIGGWHIDHILPCVVFYLKDPEEQMKCFHYSNLQPMWAIQNFDKNASFLTNFESLDLMNRFINTHKMPSSAKVITKTNKVGRTTYQIKYKIH